MADICNKHSISEAVLNLQLLIWTSHSRVLLQYWIRRIYEAQMKPSPGCLPGSGIRVSEIWRKNLAVKQQQWEPGVFAECSHSKFSLQQLENPCFRTQVSCCNFPKIRTWAQLRAASVGRDIFISFAKLPAQALVIRRIHMYRKAFTTTRFNFKWKPQEKFSYIQKEGVPLNLVIQAKNI